MRILNISEKETNATIIKKKEVKRPNLSLLNELEDETMFKIGKDDKKKKLEDKAVT